MMKRNSIDWAPLVGLIVYSGLAALATWLVFTFFWPVVLTTIAVVFLVWLGWPRISWWLTVGRVQYRTRRAIRQNNAAYLRSRERMQRIARTYRGW